MARPRLRRALEPTFHSRYECKYLVDPMIVPEIRHFLSSFTEPDDFALKHPGYRYPICSLYLDSPALDLYRQTVGGEMDRFKLRVRTYEDNPATPAFVEVKRKLNSIVHKRRAALSRQRVSRILAGEKVSMDDLHPEALRDVDYFCDHLSLIEARPVLRVKYNREAYQSRGNEPVRITLDTDLQHALSLDGELNHGAGRWVSTPLGGVIVEVKFTERFPWWVQDFVQTFALVQRAVPKYILSLDHLTDEGRESALALAGFALPPERRG